MIWFRSGSCLSPAAGGIKENSVEKARFAAQNHVPHDVFYALALFAFTRFYVRVLAGLNQIIRRLKRNVILRNAIKYVEDLKRGPNATCPGLSIAKMEDWIKRLF